MNRATCVFGGCGISLIGDVEVLDRDRRALGLAYAPRSVEEGGRKAVRAPVEVVLGISPCRPGRRDA